MYGQKLELAEQETNFVRSKVVPLEEELTKLQLEKKSLEIENEQTKKALEDKLKKLEAERLSGVHAKNNEIKKMAEENKTQLAKVHEKEAEVRRLSQEAEQAKLAASRSE